MRVTNTLAVLVVALLLSATAVETAGAQGNAAGSLRGRVFLPDGSSLNAPVKVSIRQLRGEKYLFYTDDTGQFFLPVVEVGAYTVVAEDDRERKFDPGSEGVEVFPRSPSFVTVYLKEKGGGAKEKRGPETVSTAELDENVPSDASKEFERGTKAAKEGKFEDAAAYMRKALSIYPGYLKARNDLGTFLLAQGKLEEAAGELAAAVKLAPKAFNPRLNLGIVQVRRREFAAAVENLDVALSLDPNSPAAHLYAGEARMGLGEADRAEKDLTTAYELGGADYALAQYHLGRLYMSRADRARARKAFQTYLRDKPDAANAAEVTRLLGILK
jgi:tetratricopeptide (TPR) repeat protein